MNLGRKKEGNERGSAAQYNMAGGGSLIHSARRQVCIKAAARQLARKDVRLALQALRYAAGGEPRALGPAPA